MNGAAVSLGGVSQWCGARKSRRCDSVLYLDAGLSAASVTGPRLDHNLSAIVEADSEDLRHRAGIEEKDLGTGPEVHPTPLDQPVRW
jgi:hypothetical protein